MFDTESVDISANPLPLNVRPATKSDTYSNQIDELCAANETVDPVTFRTILNQVRVGFITQREQT